MNTFKDRAGREVKVGDFIIYGHALGRCASLQFGRVLSITSEEVKPYPGSREPRTDWKIGVRGVDENAWTKDGRKPRLMRAGTLQYPDRIILANYFMPSKLKELYGPV